MILFILANPSSGNGQAEKVIKKIKTEYPSITVRPFLTRNAGDERYQVAEILKEYSENDRLLILGGDGTLSKTLKELPNHIAFAYYATGSGNDFARSLAIKSLEDVLDALLSNKKEMITLLTYKDGVVVNSLDFGFVARVINYSEKSWLKRQLKKLGLGKLSYIIYAIKTLFTNKAVDLEVFIDQEKVSLNNLFFITFANNRYFGGGIMIWPTASVFNECLDIVYITNQGLLKNTLSLLDLLFKNHLKSSHIRHLSARTVYLKVNKGDYSQVDGELIELNETILEKQERFIYL